MFTESVISDIKEQLKDGTMTEEQFKLFSKCLWDASACDLSLLAHYAPDKFTEYLHDSVHQAFPHCDIEIS